MELARGIQLRVVRLVAGHQLLIEGHKLHMDELEVRWMALVEAVHRELHRDEEACEVGLEHHRRALRLRARRTLDHGRQETITVRLTADEILRRPPEALAREFARTYYACT